MSDHSIGFYGSIASLPFTSTGDVLSAPATSLSGSPSLVSRPFPSASTPRTPPGFSVSRPASARVFPSQPSFASPSFNPRPIWDGASVPSQPSVPRFSMGGADGIYGAPLQGSSLSAGLGLLMSTTAPPATLFPATGLLPPLASSSILGGVSSALSPFPSDFGMPAYPNVSNVRNHVTIELKSVEDYASWCTQFIALLVSQQIGGFVDGSLVATPVYIVNSYGATQHNPQYIHWLKIDQLIRSWLFATISRDVMSEVSELIHSASVWECLQRRYQSVSATRSMELKHRLTTLNKSDDQSLEEFLREVKVIADALNAIRTPVADRELIEYVVFGLGPDYDHIVTTLMNLGPLTFNDFRVRLLEHDSRTRHRNSRGTGPTVHPAFAATPFSTSVVPSSSTSASTKSKNGKGRWKNKKGSKGNSSSSTSTPATAVPSGDGATASTGSNVGGSASSSK